MTDQPGKHIYLAAGFFNDDQRDLCSFIESLEGKYTPIYSPRIDGGVLRPESTNEERKAVFESNCVAIETAAWVLAVVDDFDPGVMWEMGFAWAKGIPTLGYSDVPGRGLNVMLAGSCQLGFVNGRDNLKTMFKNVEYGLDAWPRNTWRGAVN